MTLLILAIKLYRLAFCGCVSPVSCCNKGIAAAELLPFRQALTTVRQISGDCWNEHPHR